MNQEMIDFFIKMQKLEKEYAQKLKDSAKEIKNPVVKAVMEAVSQDSFKHSMLYEVITELLSKEHPFISEEVSEHIRKEIDEHIRTETEMIKVVREALEKGVSNKAVKFLLESILRDEVFHHALLTKVNEMIVKRETFTESDMWDLIWKESVWHGTPGG